MTSKISIVYLTLWMATIALGMFQLGYGISVFNIFLKTLHIRFQHEKSAVFENRDDFNRFLTAAFSIGATIGTFTGGYLCSFGRRFTILLMNAVILVSSLLWMIFNFYVFLIGRLLVGYAAGVFTVTSPLFITECSPPEVAGSLGAINQFMVTAGIMVAYMFGFVIPYEHKPNDKSVNNEEINETQVYRMVILVHALISIVQVALVLFVFTKDTPKFYRQVNNEQEAQATEGLIYAEIGMDSDSEPDSTNDANNKIQTQEKVVPFWAHFSDMYRTAFFIAWLMGVYQQLTGINAVIFYSSELFSTGDSSTYDDEQRAKIGTMLVGVVNCVSAMIAIPLLNYYGRKMLLILGAIGMAGWQIALGLIAMDDTGSVWLIAFTLIYLCFFEFSVGSIFFLYAAEITTETGVSIASALVWIFSILFGLFTTSLFDALGPFRVYFLFASVWVLATILIVLFVKETKELSKQDLKLLYVPKNFYKFEEQNNEENERECEAEQKKDL